MNSNRLPGLTFHEPGSIEGVIELKKEFGQDAVILAGGTDVIPLLKRRNIAARHVINIKRIQQLHRISAAAGGGLAIGAAATLREITSSQLVSDSCPILSKAAASVAFNQIRNMATLAGNICVDNKCPYFNQTKLWWQSRPDCFKRGGDQCYVVKGGQQCYALSVGDTVSALITLDAELVIIGPDGEKRLLLEKFYTGDGRNPYRLDADELIAAVRTPSAANVGRAGFMKKSLRGSVDFAIATLAMRLRKNGSGLQDMRIALNGVSTRPIRAKKAEAHLMVNGIDKQTIGEAIGLVLEDIGPLSLIGASALVRRKMIGAMFEDLVEALTG